MQFRVEMFNFPNHPNLSGPNSRHHQRRTSGGCTSKERRRRDIQLALRYLF